MKNPKEPKRDQDIGVVRRSLLPSFGRKKTVTERRRIEDHDEIDERELDKVSGGRIYRVDL